MISLSQILPRAQRHTSFTVTSGLAVTTETRGGGCREGVCVWGGGFGRSVCMYGVRGEGVYVG